MVLRIFFQLFDRTNSILRFLVELITAVTFLFFSSSFLWADFQKGLMFSKRNDYQNAIREWKPLSDEGHQGAQYHLGWIYENGIGLKKNLVEAERLYKLSASQGNVKAQANLGLMYLKGEGIKRDLREAVRWIKRSAESGYPKSQYALGLIYTRGLGVKQNKKEAMKWYKLSIGSGYNPCPNRSGFNKI